MIDDVKKVFEGKELIILNPSLLIKIIIQESRNVSPFPEMPKNPKLSQIFIVLYVRKLQHVERRLLTTDEFQSYICASFGLFDFLTQTSEHRGSGEIENTLAACGLSVIVVHVSFLQISSS